MCSCPRALLTIGRLSLAQLRRAYAQLTVEVDADAEAGQGTGELIEGWYTRARREDVIAILQLAPPEQRHLSARQTAERFSDLVGDIPDADEVMVRHSFGDDDASISYLLKHDDLGSLRSASLALQQHLASYDKTYFVRDDQKGSLPELRFTLLPGAEKLGITVEAVSRQVRQAFYGRSAVYLRTTGMFG